MHAFPWYTNWSCSSRDIKYVAHFQKSDPVSPKFGQLCWLKLSSRSWRCWVVTSWSPPHSFGKHFVFIGGKKCKARSLNVAHPAGQSRSMAPEDRKNHCCNHIYYGDFLLPQASNRYGICILFSIQCKLYLEFSFNEAHWKLFLKMCTALSDCLCIFNRGLSKKRLK